MAFIRFTAFKCYILLTISNFLNGEIINPYSCYVKKGLIYIAFIFLFRYQLFSYLKCTKVNIQLSYNVYFIPFNKYICLIIYY
jgi:hypothetical protein